LVERKVFHVCPNPECSDLLRTGVQQEFDYRTSHCSACGAALVDAQTSPTDALAAGPVRVPPAPKVPAWNSPISLRGDEAYRRASVTLGMRFFPRDENISKLAPLRLFQRGGNRGGRDILVGDRAGGEVLVFAYHYETVEEHSIRPTDHDQTVAAFRVPGRRLPQFSMRPEGLLDRIGALLGMQDIDFDSHPEFSTRYVLKGGDEGAIRTCFGSRILDHFAQEEGWSVEGCGEWLILYRDEVQVSGEDLPRFVEETTRIAALYPTDVDPQHPMPGSSYFPYGFYPCPACGGEIAVETTECPTCGSVLDDGMSLSKNTCPGCGEAAPAKASECPSCGLALHDKG
jgi:hypothetical protein